MTSNQETPQDVLWEEPPPIVRTTGYGPWAAALAPFRKKPGKSGRLPGGPFEQTYAYNLASRINTGKVSGVARGEFSATSRQMPEGYYVWVEYVGGGDD